MSDLSQAEADALLGLEKVRIHDNRHPYPPLGGTLSIDLASRDGRESFLLDLQRGRLNLAKGGYQNRGRQIVSLARLDFGGPPHRNPDGEEIGPVHLHLYREGYADKGACPLPADAFSGATDPMKLLEEFMAFCRIIKPPIIDAGLFTS